MAKTRVAAVEGLFTLDPDQPRLIGGRARSRGSYFFPKSLAGADPACQDDEIDEVLLSRTGRLWSFTTGEYAPPAPYVIPGEEFEPYVVAAVELDEESLVVLGQVVAGVSAEELRVGMEMELALGVLYSDDEHDYLVWKWAPVGTEDTGMARDGED
ncbi:MAG: OB-fold domain-containing protein [bacterium]|nr:OB-fold domain-containing protein [bacterium]MCY4194880.1 OB-fold domain-containing protein [bacterium]MCY4272976.1 OB-fold domain-containing protein [bacterium]